MYNPTYPNALDGLLLLLVALSVLCSMLLATQNYRRGRKYYKQYLKSNEECLKAKAFRFYDKAGFIPYNKKKYYGRKY